MHPPVLTIPTQHLQNRPRPYLKTRALERWLAELPAASAEESARRLLTQLRTLNQSQYPVDHRMTLLERLHPAVNRLVATLSNALRHAPLPLTDRLQNKAELLDQLLEELGCGYKLAVSELSLVVKPSENDQLLLQDAVFGAVISLGRRLLDAYLLYQPEPPNVWRDINQLYRFAETHDFHTAELDTSALAKPHPENIDAAYKQVLLLALSEPYGLMQNEAQQLYDLACAWEDDCQLFHFGDLPPRGEFVIDLALDRGPRYVAEATDVAFEDACIVDFSAARAQVDARLGRLLHRILEHQASDTRTLRWRQERDMLLRLTDLWHGSASRREERKPLGDRIQLAIGLNPCHHFAADEAPFTPAMDELKVRSARGHGAGDAAFADSYRDALREDRKRPQGSHALSPWQQVNTSSRGMAISCAGKHCQAMPTSVGELVGFRFGARTRERWKTGVVRWLQSLPDIGLEMGIMHLGANGVPATVRGIEGFGAGTGFFRAMLIAREVSVQEIRTLVLPASLYDVNSVLIVNVKQRLFRARLSRLVRTTRAFAQFEFEVTKEDQP